MARGSSVTRPDGNQSLRVPGAILLISCYELGHQPIGLALSLGFLERVGFRPDGMDLAVEAFDLARVRRARFIGISVPMHTALRLGVRVAEEVRAQLAECHICFYGLYASLNAEYLLEHYADSVIGGEYEEALVNLVESLDRSGKNGMDLEDIPGVSRRRRIAPPVLKRLNWMRTASVPHRARQASLPVLPSRNSLPPLDRYARLERDSARHTVGYVEASRGCLHRCLHCPIVPVYEGRFFLVPADIVLEDIRQQVHAGAKHVTFGDPDFLNGPGHSLKIVRAMHGEFNELTFDFTAKIEHLLKHRALLPELAGLGCLFVVSAVESFSDAVLTHLEKGHTCADVLAALDILQAAGITLRPSLVAFTPWTTLKDYIEMLEIVRWKKLVDAIDPVQYAIRLLIPPGSALLRRPEIHAFLGPLDQAGFQYHWTHPDPRMDQLHRIVAAAVEKAAEADEDPAVTFKRLHRLAFGIADREAPSMRSETEMPYSRSRLPRLTEPWFCCAEPTEKQFRPLHAKGP